MAHYTLKSGNYLHKTLLRKQDYWQVFHILQVMVINKIKTWLIIIKNAGASFIADDAFKLSASLSYYTVFSLGPIIMIVMSLSGILFGQVAVEGKIYGQIKGLVGNDAAMQIQDIIKNIELSRHGTAGAITGFIFLFIGATGVFAEIQGSINYIWSVRAKPKKGWIRFLKNRVISFSLIIATGFILLVSLIVNAVMDVFNEKLLHYFPDTIYVFYTLNNVLIFLVIGLLFAIIFKVLPDAIIAWKDAIIGACFTSLLFLAGKFLIGYYLGRSNVGITYGAAASIIIILLWVYYSSIILYFGAEFTKIYSLRLGSGIKPSGTAVYIIKQESKEIPVSNNNDVV
jgi:membrane protein